MELKPLMQRDNPFVGPSAAKGGGRMSTGQRTNGTRKDTCWEAVWRKCVYVFPVAFNFLATTGMVFLAIRAHVDNTNTLFWVPAAFFFVMLLLTSINLLIARRERNVNDATRAKANEVEDMRTIADLLKELYGLKRPLTNKDEKQKEDKPPTDKEEHQKDHTPERRVTLRRLAVVAQEEMDRVISNTFYLIVNLVKWVFLWTLGVAVGVLLRETDWVKETLAEQINIQAMTGLTFLLSFMFDRNLGAYEASRKAWHECVLRLSEFVVHLRNDALTADNRDLRENLVTGAVMLLFATKVHCIRMRQCSDHVAESLANGIEALSCLSGTLGIFKSEAELHPAKLANLRDNFNAQCRFWWMLHSNDQVIGRHHEVAELFDRKIAYRLQWGILDAQVNMVALAAPESVNMVLSFLAMTVVAIICASGEDLWTGVWHSVLVVGIMVIPYVVSRTGAISSYTFTPGTGFFRALDPCLFNVLLQSVHK